MNKTQEGYVDLTVAEDLLRVSLREAASLHIRDQRLVKGAPPQPGIPCPKCTYRNLPEAYEINTPLGQNFIASKQACELLIEQAGEAPRRIDPTILNMLIHQNEYHEEHVDHVAGVHTPGIALFMAFKQANAAAILCYLVDGTHRAVAALRAGRDFLGYVLVPKEALKCLSHMDGKPNAQFIGQHSDALFDGRRVIPLP